MSPKWLFFPAPAASAPQYIYTVQTDRSVSRGVAQPDRRKQDSTGVESGDLADQFSPFATSNQFQRIGLAGSINQISFRVQGNDTSTSGFENTTNIQNNITAMSITVGSNTLNAESITIGGNNTKPTFELNTTGNAAGTFWTDNNLDDTDNITIVVTLTF